MSQPDIADIKPISIEVKQGEDYFWCACGKSAKQPFCDGSHRGTDFVPLKFTAESSETAYLCMCKTNKESTLL